MRSLRVPRPVRRLRDPAPLSPRKRVPQTVSGPTASSANSAAGVVYEAEDSRLPRRVALKVLSPQFAASTQLRLRFQREAELASKLDHPHVCTVYEAGEDDGAPYLAMRYVEGRTLSDLVLSTREMVRTTGTVHVPQKGEDGDVESKPSESRLDLDRVLVLFEKAARALHYAHEKGLIHRDIKPHNIMVTADGEPVLLDFGLAREEAGEGHQLTQTGSLMGTPAYMSPEQLMAQRIKLDRRTDVYSMGVSLYECLTLKLPFEAPTVDKLYQQILTADPEDPRRLNRDMPADLKVVLDTALEKDRDRRYQSAQDLAEELRRIREHEPIRAKPVRLPTRLLRWSQRHPAVAASVFVSFAALAGGLAFSVFHWNRAQGFLEDARDAALSASLGQKQARRERDAKNEALAKEAEARRAAESGLKRARAAGLANASALAAGTDTMLALLLAREAVRTSPEPDVVFRLHEAILGSPDVWRSPPQAGKIIRAALSPDQRRIVTASEEGHAVLWDLEGREIRRLEGIGAAGFAFSPSGDRLLCWAGSRAEVWDSSGDARQATADFPGERALAGTILPDGVRILLFRGEDRTGVVRDLGGKEIARTRSLNGDPYADTPWGPSFVPPAGSFVLSSAYDFLLADPAGRTLWEPGLDGGMPMFQVSESGGVLLCPMKDSSRPSPLRFRAADGAESVSPFEVENAAARLSPNGRLVAAKAEDREFVLWEPGSPSSTRFVGGIRQIVAFNPDGTRLLAECGVDDDYRLGLFSLDGKREADFPGGRGYITNDGFTKDGRCVFAFGDRRFGDGMLRIWTPRGDPVLEVPASEVVRSVMVSEDGEVRLFVDNGRLRVLHRRVFEAGLIEDDASTSVCLGFFLPDGRRVLTTNMGGGATLWRLPGKKMARFGVPVRGMIELTERCPGFTPDGSGVVIGHGDSVARLWPLEGGEHLPLLGHEDTVYSAAVSRDGGRVLTLSGDGRAHLWNPAGASVAVLEHPDHARGKPGCWLVSARFSPDGGSVITAATDGLVQVWDAGGRATGVVIHGKAPMLSASWAPDAGRILTCSEKEVGLWTPKGEPAGDVPAGKEAFHGAEFSPRGDGILIAEGKAGGRLWTPALQPVAAFPGERPAFSPDGGTILTIVDGACHLWDLSGRKVAVLPRRGRAVEFAAMSPDGRMVLTLDGRVGLVWLVDVGELLRLAESRITRGFAPEERETYKDLLGE